MHSTSQQPQRLTQSERLARMRLARSANIGPVTFRKMLDRFGSARAAIEALPDITAHSKAPRQINLASRDDTVTEIETAKACNAKPVILGDPEYPALLARIDDAPPYFYAIGKTELLTRTCIGMVGARNASANGCGFARKLSHDLASAGYVVVSGMARGIDGAAHSAALQGATSHAGGTIAVLGGRCRYYLSARTSGTLWTIVRKRLHHFGNAARSETAGKAFSAPKPYHFRSVTGHRCG